MSFLIAVIITKMKIFGQRPYKKQWRYNMEEKLLKVLYPGTLKIGDTKIPCAVLEDGTRILRERSVAKALGKKGSGAHWQKKRSSEKGALLPEYVSAKNLESFIDEETMDSLKNPVTYETRSGKQAQGIRATLLSEICNIWLKAREKGALIESQEKTAQKAEILLRGFAKIGIIALVDEATGYQEVRDKLALQEILDRYLRKEWAKWAKRFPDEFYMEMFRLKGWQWRGMSVNRPILVGKYTDDIVYKRLAPGVRDELRKRNPKDDAGRRKQKHHQWLTEDMGVPALSQHLTGVMALMRAAPNYEVFKRMLVRAFPKPGQQLELPYMQEVDETGENN